MWWVCLDCITFLGDTESCLVRQREGDGCFLSTFHRLQGFISPLLLRVHEQLFWKTEVTCEGEQLINIDILIGHPGIVSPYNPGHILVFRCTDVNLKMHGQRTIECLSDGKWNHPYPTCRGPGKCGPPPPVNDGDTIEIPKKEYNTGERVEYICFNKYTLELRPPFSRSLTCQQGEWSGNIKCLKPCTVTVEEMNERGIELAYTDLQKMFVPHNDHLTFACKRGKVTVGIALRQKCNDGVITLPECV
uniref:Beta-2-glycoprotein 1 n=1 Tax=Cyprinus carpio TaxID=7962 RepID=A0A8C1P2E9_CYPCA